MQFNTFVLNYRFESNGAIFLMVHAINRSLLIIKIIFLSLGHPNWRNLVERDRCRKNCMDFFSTIFYLNKKFFF